MFFDEESTGAGCHPTVTLRQLGAAPADPEHSKLRKETLLKIDGWEKNIAPPQMSTGCPRADLLTAGSPYLIVGTPEVPIPVSAPPLSCGPPG